MAYQASMSPLYGFCQEDDSFKSEFNATAFLASLAIIVLLVNSRLPTRGIRCYAVWVCAAIAFVGLMGAFVGGCYGRKISAVDVLFLALAVIVCISLQIALVVQRLAPEEDDLGGSVAEDDEVEFGIAGEAPLGVLEISTPVLGSALTVILGIPVMATVDFLVKLPVAILIVSILMSIWQRSFARLLGALAIPLRRLCVPNHGASTPREQMVSVLCHGACKVIDSLRSGTWMLVFFLVIWKPELRQNLKFKFKVSKISAGLGVLFVSAAPVTTASGSTMIGTPATTTAATAVMDTPSSSATPSASGTSMVRRRRDRPLVQAEFVPRARRNRRPNSRFISDQWDNS